MRTTPTGDSATGGGDEGLGRGAQQWQDVTYTRRREEQMRGTGVTTYEEEEDEQFAAEADEYGESWHAIGVTGETMEGFDGEQVPLRSQRNQQRPPMSMAENGTSIRAQGDGLALMRNRTNQSAAQDHYKALYRGMKQNDRVIEKDIDLDTLERRAIKSKERWDTFMKGHDEVEDVKEMLAAEQEMDDRYSSKDGADLQHLFSTMYARAVVVRQLWPWTMLLDLKTDKIFYRNEDGGFFQTDAPAELLVAEQQRVHEMEEDFLDMPDDDSFLHGGDGTDKSVTFLTGAGSAEADHREQVLSRKAALLQERYKHEVTRRQVSVEAKKEAPKKLRETFQARQLASVSVPDRLKPHMDEKRDQNEAQKMNLDLQRASRSVFTVPPVKYMTAFEEEQKELAARGLPTVRDKGLTRHSLFSLLSSICFTHSPLVFIDTFQATFPVQDNFLMAGLTLDNDERWAQSIVLLDRLRRMAPAPRSGSPHGQTPQHGKGKRRKGRSGGGRKGEEGGIGSPTSAYDDETVTETASHAGTHDLSFGSLAMSPMRTVHFQGDDARERLEMAASPTLSPQQQHGKPPAHPGYAHKIDQRERHHGVGEMGSPLFSQMEDDQGDDPKSHDDHDDGDNGGSPASETPKSKDKWAASHLFDVLDMSDAERKEAEKIYKLRTARESASAFAVGGAARRVNPAPLLTQSLGVSKIPVLRAKEAGAVCVIFPFPIHPLACFVLSYPSESRSLTLNISSLHLVPFIISPPFGSHLLSICARATPITRWRMTITVHAEILLCAISRSVQATVVWRVIHSCSRRITCARAS